MELCFSQGIMLSIKYRIMLPRYIVRDLPDCFVFNILFHFVAVIRLREGFKIIEIIEIDCKSCPRTPDYVLEKEKSFKDIT